MLVVFLKTYFNKLKNSSVYKSLLNNYFIIGFYLLLFLFTLNNLLAIIIFTIYGLYIFKKSKIISYLSFCLIIMVLARFLYLESITTYQEKNMEAGKVVELERKEQYQRIKIKTNKTYVLIYDYDFYNLEIGDVIKVEGKALGADKARIENGFDNQLYSKHQKITNTILSRNIKIVEKTYSLGRIKIYFQNYLENNFQKESLIFLKAIIIGDSSGFDNEFSQAIINNGILHLFAISGLHISLFIGIIYQLLKYINIEEKYIEMIACIFLFLYLVITGFSPSVVRASLIYYFSLINKKGNLGFSSLDIIAIVFIMLIIINPYYMYNLGFVLSFTAAVTIILISTLLKDYRPTYQILIISIATMVVTFPIVINLNNEMNLLSPISNLIFIQIVELIILPISFFIIVFPIFKGVYYYLILAFEKLTMFFGEYFTILIPFPNFSFVELMLYYIILYLAIRFYHLRRIQYTLITILMVFLIVLSNISYFQLDGEINFLDLYNGEAIVIRDYYSECVAVIDTGDGKNLEVTKYLKSKGIKKIDYLILTHNHLDHNGEALNIINKLRVNKLVVSEYDNSISMNDRVLKVKAGDRLTCGKITFNILHPNQRYQNENDNSIVIHSRIGHLNFLFLGDVSKSIEEKIAQMNLVVDVIKVAHHGSKTSTSSFLIDQLKPQYAIIQTGRVEKFSFPDQETIDTLNNYHVKVYRTDINYSIKYQYNKKNSIFITLK